MLPERFGKGGCALLPGHSKLKLHPPTHSTSVLMHSFVFFFFTFLPSFIEV